MIDKNGIYLSVDGDSAVRVIVENNAKIQTDKVKISEEMIGKLEFNMTHYETVVEHISEKTEPLDGIGEYSEDQLASVFNIALDLTDAVRENDLTSGVLLRASINKLLDTEDDGTAMSFLLSKNNVVEALWEPLNTRCILYKHLKSRSKLDPHF